MGDVAAGAKAALRPYLDAAVARGALGASRLESDWTDVGSAERLAELNRR
jgi:MurNAc alpha-1-phosphate uridylyltransferase